MNTYAGRMNFMPRDGFNPAQSRLKIDTMTTPSLSERLDHLRGASPKWRERYDELVARLRALEVGACAPDASPFAVYATGRTTLHLLLGMQRAVAAPLAWQPVLRDAFQI
jgi:hypothetical protein